MLRRIVIFVAAVGIVGLGVYWWLTEPPARLAVSEPFTPNPAYGEVIFNAGGCASCHAVPNQQDRL